MILSKKQALRFVLDLNSISWALLDLFKQDPEPNGAGSHSNHTHLSRILSKTQIMELQKACLDKFVLDSNSVSWALLDLFEQDPEPI